MVNVAPKQVTVRRAVAQCEVHLDSKSYDLLKTNRLDKGPAVAIAEVAGILAAKRTQDLVPLCH